MGTISRTEWSRPTSGAEAVKRGVGRARYNRRRAGAVEERQRLEWERYGEQIAKRQRGIVATIARAFGVSETTASRDVEQLLAEQATCPVCNRPMPAETLQMALDRRRGLPQARQSEEVDGDIPMWLPQRLRDALREARAERRAEAG